MSAPPPQPPAVCVCCKRISSCGLPSHQVCRASLADFWSFVIFPCYSLWSRSVCHSAQEALQHPGHCLNLWTCEIILRLFLTRYRNCLAFRHRDFMSHKVGKNFFFFNHSQRLPPLPPTPSHWSQQSFQRSPWKETKTNGQLFTVNDAYCGSNLTGLFWPWNTI